MSRGSKVVDAKSDLEADSVASGVHHIGVSVASRDDALAFWESFLGRKATWRTRLDRPYLGEIIGIPGVEIDGAFIDLPGGVILELLEYQTADRRANPSATANPGNVHICLAVEDADAAWRRAVDCGAAPVRREGPVEVDNGPNRGARVAYLRIHDGVTLEVFQRPPAARAEPA
jgi:catechol 2,3-dioxygenase-like lactoylglutathione lyase family enzyme